MASTERKFYIMDTGNNYYKLNKENKLVRADDKKEATILSEKQVDEHLYNAAKKRMFNVVELAEELETTSEIMCDTNGIDDYMNVLPVSKESGSDLISKINDFCSVIDNIEIRESMLNVQQSNVDKKISDIVHYIEFNEIDEHEKIKACDMLKELRCERRKIKDELRVICIMKSTFLNDSLNQSLHKCINEVEKMSDRKYTPRFFSSLFTPVEKFA